MKLVEIVPSSRADKRLMALFDSGVKVHFGLRGGSTFIDHHDEVKKENYIKRHRVNEDWSRPDSAGTLSRYVLWNKRTMKESVEDYKRRYKM